MRVSPTVAGLARGLMAVFLLVYVFGTAALLLALVWAGVGGIVGWIGSLVMRSDTQGEILKYIVVGALGGVSGVLLYGGSLTEGGPVERILSAIIGSMILVAVAAAVSGVRGSRNTERLD